MTPESIRQQAIRNGESAFDAESLAYAATVHHDRSGGLGGVGFTITPAQLGFGGVVLGIGVILWFIGSSFAPYAFGAAALIYFISALIWIIRHPIRTLIGFVLLGSLGYYGFSKLREAAISAANQTATQSQVGMRSQPQVKAKAKQVKSPASVEADK